MNNHQPNYQYWILSAATLFVLLGSNLIYGQASDSPTTEEAGRKPVALTKESVAALQKKADVSALDEETKTRVDELFQLAIVHASKAETYQKQQHLFEAAQASAKQRTSQLQQQVADLKVIQPSVISETGSLRELEQRLSASDLELKDLKAKLAKADGETAARSARRKAIRDRLIEAKQLVDNTSATTVEAANGESPALTSAKKAESQSQQQALQAEIPMLESELAALDAEDAADFVRMNRDYLALAVATKEEELQLFQSAVSKLRTDDARKQIANARQEAKDEDHPVLRALAEHNVALAEEYQSLARDIVIVKEDLTTMQSQREHWEAIANSARDKVEAIGLTDTIGAMLRKQRVSLPNPRTFLTKIDARTETINAAQLVLLEREEERTRTLDETLLLTLSAESSLPNAFRDEAESLTAKRNELLTPLIRSQNSYYDTLVELSNAEQQVANQISEFAEFIDERVLWVRSSQPIWKSFSIQREDFWLLSPARWKQAGTLVQSEVRQRIPLYLLAGVVLAFLLRNRVIFRRRIREFGQTAESGSCTEFRPTLYALTLTILAAAPWPALLGFLSWRLARIPDSNQLLQVLSSAMCSVAVGYYPLEFLRLAFKPHGLAEAHFGWHSNSVQHARVCVRAIMLVVLPLVLVTCLSNVNTIGLGNDTIERLAFIMATIALTWFFGRLISTKNGALCNYVIQNPNAWVSRLQPIWFWLITLSPLVLTGLAVFGFYYTAQQLAWRFYATGCLAGGSLMVTAIVSRLLLVQRRKLSIEQARQRREAQLKAKLDETIAMSQDELPSADVLREQISQSRNLLQTIMLGVALIGIWVVWIDVLPALGFLEKWPLWQSTVEVTEMVTGDDGGVSFKTKDVLDNITIADVFLAIIVAGLTFVAARNIPGVLEISILQRLPIEASVRYAITTIVSYLIVVVGFVVAFSWVGVHWNQVQWMATALTFGLAFGLQEMFANFVAGIIILFERPVRVGDIVTIDDVSGVVSRVQIRATTVTNWDRQDYIVPNKDFITGRVLNWTLSDQVNRIVFNVGVAYGSDTDKTLATLTRIVKEHSLIVADPAPIVTFEEFGASSLNFVIRCFIAMKDMPSRLQVIHDLHKEIDDTFRSEKIEIAFPQQDLHIRTVSPELLLTKANGTPAKQTVEASILDSEN